MKILATDHDFCAREVHYKRRIFTWGLDKKKLSEMAFAARVVQDRRSLGKDTRIQIRGDTVSLEDMQRYWKRKPSKAEDTLLDACTPSRLRYWTPSPSLAASRPSTRHVKSLTTSEGDDYMSTTAHIDGHQAETLQHLGDYEFRTSLVPVMTPGCLRNQELVLYQAKMYIQGSLEVGLGPEYSGFHQVFSRFEMLVSEWFIDLAYGHAPYTAAMTELELYDTIPELPFETDPLLLMSLLSRFAIDCLWAGKGGFYLVSQGVQKLLWKLLQHTSAAYPTSFPLVTLFQAGSQHLNEITSWTTAILEMAADLSVSSSSNGTSLNWWVFSDLAELYRVDSDYQTSLHYAKRAEIAGTASSQLSLEKSLLAKERQISAYRDMGALNQAETEINDALGTCLAGIQNGRDMWDLNSRMLYQLSEIRHRQGRTAEARHLKDQALRARLEHFAPGDALAMDIVAYYKRTKSVHATEPAGPMQSSCQEPLGWGCEQVDLLYGG